MLLKIKYIFLFFILTLPCFGQVDYLTISDGLPHNTVFCALQDSDGYIWVGTQNGLAKYDGYSFEIYASKGKSIDSQEFKGNKISALYEDKAGNLWVGTEREGLNIKKRGSDFFENLKENDAFINIKEYEITSISEDEEGNILIGTLGGGVLQYNFETKKNRHFTVQNSGLSDDRVFDVKMDNYGKIWVAAAGIGLNYLNEKGQFTLSHEWVPNESNMSGYRKRIMVDGDDIWLTVEGAGLYRINVKSLNYKQFNADSDENNLSSNAVIDVLRGNDGLIYIALDGSGMNIYDETQDKMSIYNTNGAGTTLNSKALVCFLKDRMGDIWIGTYNGGLNIIKNQKTWFEFLRPELSGAKDLRNSSVLSLYQAEDETIWIGTDGGGLNKLIIKDGNYTFENFKHEPNNPNSLSGNAVKTIFEDSRNRLLLGVFRGGLDIYDPKTKTFQHFDIGDNVIWSIAEKDGKYWLGTLDKDIVIFDPDTGEQEVLIADENNPYSLPQKDIMVVFSDKQNQMWVGTQQNGLSRWNEKEKYFDCFKYNAQDSFSINDNEIRSIFQDSKDRIWIGTQGGGLNRWLGENRFSAITEAEGLIANSVMAITEDKEGMLWVTTFLGISRLNPETGDIKNFNFHTKENSNQFNQMAALCTTEGKLFFGGINGLNAIQPQQVEEKYKQAADIIFTDLKVFNKSVSVGELENGQIILHQPIEKSEAIYLDYSDSSFSIEFAAMDFTNPQENEFSYKMEGFDTDWQLLNPGEHSVHYTNLDPGEFTLKVRFKETVAELAVFIQPPFWKTWWFRLLSAILISSIIIGGIIFFTKRRDEGHKQQMLKAQSEILQLRNENLKTEVNAKNSKLMFSSAQMAHKNEILTKIKAELKSVEKEANISLRKLLNSIDIELMSEDYWTEFNNYVNQVDKDYSKKLMAKHPKLTQNDLRMCTLLRINLSTKEIASLLNISTRGVEQGRYRLKKRLDLTNEDDLIKYISTFE